jgi:hypothetical protein
MSSGDRKEGVSGGNSLAETGVFQFLKRFCDVRVRAALVA